MADALSLCGDVRVVDNVPRAFAELFVEEAPPSLTLSGGSTARRCYEILAGADIAWGRVDVFFGDERWVPTDDPDSNERMARQVLLDRVGPHAVHSMRNAGDSIDRAADAYDRLLREHGPLDFVHLGLGPDGHTASLFPGSRALDERERLVLATGDDLHPHPRLTVTYPALSHSLLAVFTVAGEEKREAVRRVKAGDDLPAARVSAARVIWLLDAPANG